MFQDNQVGHAVMEVHAVVATCMNIVALEAIVLRFGKSCVTYLSKVFT